MLNKIIKELENLIGEEFTLLEMDNEIQRIIGSENETKNSIFDGNTKDYIDSEEYAYTVWENELGGDTRDINIMFSILEDNKDDLDVLVTITDIELL